MELFKKGSLTARLDTESAQFDHSDSKTIKVLTVKTTGMGAYQKDVGYPKGSITTTWTPFELNQDRGVQFMLDNVDNDEVLALTIGRAAQEFTDFHMIPELDAYRFMQYAKGAGKIVNGGLYGIDDPPGGSGGKILLMNIDRAATYMNEMNVPETGRILYVNQDLELTLRAALSRVWSNDFAVNTKIESYNGLQIVYVPSKRFNTLIKLNTGANNEWGYDVDDDSKEINFMLMYPRAVIQASKTAKAKFFTVEENQTADSALFQFRIFHDAFVIPELKDGVYVDVRDDS